MHVDNPVGDISLNDLERLFEGRLTRLGSLTGIILYQHRSSREQFFSQVMNTTVSRASRAWIGLVFSGDAAVPPTDFDGADEVMRAVSERRASVGFMPLSRVDTDRVKVLLVDGRSVDHPSYAIR